MDFTLPKSFRNEQYSSIFLFSSNVMKSRIVPTTLQANEFNQNKLSTIENWENKFV